LTGLGAIASNEASTGNYQDIVTLSVDRNEDDNAALIDDMGDDANGGDIFSLGALAKVCTRCLMIQLS
jgi:hypothetical protein